MDMSGMLTEGRTGGASRIVAAAEEYRAAVCVTVRSKGWQQDNGEKRTPAAIFAINAFLTWSIWC